MKKTLLLFTTMLLCLKSSDLLAPKSKTALSAGKGNAKAKPSRRSIEEEELLNEAIGKAAAAEALQAKAAQHRSEERQFKDWIEGRKANIPNNIKIKFKDAKFNLSGVENTALILSIIKKNNAVFNNLIQIGADLNAQDNNGATALIIAVDQNNQDAINVLIQAKADLNIQDNNGATALMVAVDRNNQDAITALIQAEANLNVQDNNGITALIIAVHQSNQDVINALIQAKANVNIQDNSGATALMVAVNQDNQNAIAALIYAKADLNIQDNNGITALMVAVDQNNQNTIDVLIQAGANLNIQNSYGGTALMIAVDQNNQNSIDALIQAGANLNMQNNDGVTALMFAVSQNNQYAIDALIRAKANANLITHTVSAKDLHKVLKLHKELITQQIELKDDSNNDMTSKIKKLSSQINTFINSLYGAKGRHGATALMLAILMNNEEIIKMLFKSNQEIDFSPTTSDRYNALMLSIKYANNAIQELVLDKIIQQINDRKKAYPNPEQMGKKLHINLKKRLRKDAMRAIAELEEKEKALQEAEETLQKEVDTYKHDSELSKSKVVAKQQPSAGTNPAARASTIDIEDQENITDGSGGNAAAAKVTPGEKLTKLEKRVKRYKKQQEEEKQKQIERNNFLISKMKKNNGLLEKDYQRYHQVINQIFNFARGEPHQTSSDIKQLFGEQSSLGAHYNVIINWQHILNAILEWQHDATQKIFKPAIRGGHSKETIKNLIEHNILKRTKDPNRYIFLWSNETLIKTTFPAKISKEHIVEALQNMSDIQVNQTQEDSLIEFTGSVNNTSNLLHGIKLRGVLRPLPSFNGPPRYELRTLYPSLI